MEYSGIGLVPLGWVEDGICPKRQLHPYCIHSSWLVQRKAGPSVLEVLSFTTLAERGIRSPHLSALHSDQSS